MNERNARVQARYDELMREGKHGHCETLFKVVNEEVARMEKRILQAIIEIDKRILGFGDLNTALNILREALEGK